MGKNGKFGKDYGKVVGKDDKSRPGWKGPGFVKKAEPASKPKKTTKTNEEETNDQPVIPVELQQLLLNVFRDSFPEILTSGELQPLLQEVKAALYERDFNRAFGRQDYLEAYSIRWSPSRAICYASILVDVQKHLTKIFPVCNATQSSSSFQATSSGGLACPDPTSKLPLKVVCFGGGAAEVVAFGGFLRYLHDTPPSDFSEKKAYDALASLSISKPEPVIDLLLLDTASWQNVVQTLNHRVTTQPPLSKYASASAKEASTALLEPRHISASFRAKDIFELSQSELGEMVGSVPALITLLFTLNELYTSSIGKATEFLLNLTTCVPPGTLLLVVDSPGSYSETTIGTEAKKYPMLWLLNHTLLETQKSRGHESTPNWETVVSDESRWFRLHEDLRYPINLENMRYQVHLYRRL